MNLPGAFIWLRCSAILLMLFPRVVHVIAIPMQHFYVRVSTRARLLLGLQFLFLCVAFLLRV